MTFSHVLMDAALWFIAVIWFISFLARGPKARKHNKRLPPPSIHCERVGDFESKMLGTVFARRQGD